MCPVHVQVGGAGAGRGSGRTLSWVELSRETVQELSGNLNSLRLDANILASIQDDILVLAESSSWSVHRSQSLLVCLGQQAGASCAARTALVVR